MEKYNKLVRDKIPDILDKQGVPYEKRVATPEELADVIEVIEALKKLPDYANVEELRKKKSEERGAFDEKIILQGEKS